MQTPYTHNARDAFMVVEASSGAVLTALLAFRPLRGRVTTAIFFAAIWVAATVPDSIDFARSLGFAASPTQLGSALHASAVLATIALLLARPHWPGLVAFAGQFGLAKLASMMTQSDLELCALHVAWLGLLLGLNVLVRSNERIAPARTTARPPSYAEDDLALFVTAVVAASIVGWFVLHHGVDSADEWAYRFQAAVFAKLHASSQSPPCYSALQSFWVFLGEGRLFSQYTPGWPLFLAPFTALRVPWLAAPVSFGLLTVGSARLARRAAKGAWSGEESAVQRAGVAAGGSMIASSTLLINGSSYFGHVFVCACFAWMVEGLCALGARDRSQKDDVLWGVVVGLAAAWALATRPPDGAVLGVSAAIYFFYLLGSKRLSVRGVAATVIAFALLGGLTLVILRLQLGKWLTTGYSLTATIHPWSTFKLSKPTADELRWAIPLQTGSYCWWPLLPALGLAGLAASLRGTGRAIAFMLVVSVGTMLTFYSFVEFGRGNDFGYGPRYTMPVVVPMAVGAGVILGGMWSAAARRMHPRSSLAEALPFVLAAAALLSCTARLAPAVYPITSDDVRMRNTVFAEAKSNGLHDAIVWIVPHTTMSDPLDLTQNMPLDLYGPPDVLYAIDRGADMKRCIANAFPGRAQYHTEGRETVRLVRE